MPAVVSAGVLGCFLFGAILIRSPFIAMGLLGLIGCVVIYLVAPQWMVYLTILVAFTTLPAALPPGKSLGSVLTLYFHEFFLVLSIIYLIPLNRARGFRLSSLQIPFAFSIVVLASFVAGVLNGNNWQWAFLEANLLLMLAGGFMLSVLIVGAGLVAGCARVMAVSLWLSAFVTLTANFIGVPLRGRNEEVVTATGEHISGVTRIISWANTPALGVLVALIAWAMTAKLRAGTLIMYGVPAAIITFLSFSRNSLVALGVATLVSTIMNFSRADARHTARFFFAAAMSFVAFFVAVAALRILGWGGWILDQISGYTDRVLGGITLGRRDESLQWRLGEMRLLASAIDQSPLVGHGFGYPYGTSLANPNGVNSRAFFSHNFYYWCMAKTGLVGLLNFLWFASVAVLAGLRSLRPEAKASAVVAAALLTISYVWPVPELVPDNVFLGMALGAALAFSQDSEAGATFPFLADFPAGRRTAEIARG